MHGTTWVLLLSLITPSLLASWQLQSLEEQRPRQQMQRVGHYHTKRHMLATEAEQKRRPTTPRNREVIKKRPGHLLPLQEEEIDNDEVISVDIGPPPMNPKLERKGWKPNQRKPKTTTSPTLSPAARGLTGLVKDVLSQLGREFLLHEPSEDFVFGQYVGNAMKNLTSNLRLNMQHDILELVVKYQRLSNGEIVPDEKSLPPKEKFEKKFQTTNNDTEEWPDFSNLAKIVG